ncbi:hypothetical protein [Actinomadura bangladeshensis]|uniref:Uncharacterized protein n=1 Tax=Actinomadura bangladeshensis TaxID=453573 RepID=A0A4R4N3E2_9ACTN|nr:hypothetical protein [Actinomadura bangladeshensis]TDC03239.1 hypothetical protein E1284_38540 [Actinomadura bangladeshensis]
MPTKVTYRYRVPFAVSWRSYLVPVGALALLVLLTALFWTTHHALLTASTVDAVRPGGVPGDSRAVLWVDEGLRYRVHVVAASEDPGSCSLNGQKANYPVTLDRVRHGGDSAEIKGYRWVGAFRAPATDYVAVTCDRSNEALRIKVDAPGAGLLVTLLVLWPVVLIWAVVKLWRTRRQSTQRLLTRRPPDPPARAARAALAAGDRTQTTVYFRNGTFVPAGTREPDPAAAFAAERLKAPRDPADFRTGPADDGGKLVAFPDLTVYLSPAEIKHAGAADLGRQALAKIRLDARTPQVARIRAAEEPATHT